jgi:hypothetical protein
MIKANNLDKLHNKSFWIWNTEEHNLEDVRTKGEFCFNHIIGLPTKEGLEKPIFDYQQLLYEAPLSGIRAFDMIPTLRYAYLRPHSGIAVFAIIPV